MRPTILACAVVQVCFAVSALGAPPISTKPALVVPRQLEGIVVHEPQSRPCGGATFVGVVVFRQPVPLPPPGAPNEVVMVSLQSERPDVARVPEVVRIKPGEQAGRFEVKTQPVASQYSSFRIVARLANERAESNVVNIRGPRITSVAGSPGVNCNGEKVTFTVSLDCPAPPSGLRLRLNGSGMAYGSESVAVTGGDSASEKLTFSRCCLGNVYASCPWSVHASLTAGDGSVRWGGASRPGSCGQPDNCPN